MSGAMSGAPTPGRGGIARARRTDRSLPALVVAAVLVVAVVTAVLVVGVTRPPALEPLADHPDEAPTEALAWLGRSAGDNCLGVARTDGTDTRPFCDDTHAGLAGWVDGDTVLLTSWSPDARGLEVDVRDGTVRGSRPGTGQSGPTDVRELTVTREGEDLLVLGADGTELWRVTIPDTYRINRSSIAPDGTHAAFVDNADRLLVVPTDGTAPPRVWAQDVTSHPDLAWASERVDDVGR